MPHHKITAPLLKSIQKFGRKIKSLDGIDEIATILAQILPGLAGPSTAFAVLGVAIPFVYLGACGMQDEYEEACEEYDEIFASNQDTRTKLLKMQLRSEYWRQVLVDKLGLEVGVVSFSPKESNLEAFATELQHFEESRNKLFITAFDQKYGWLGTVGMGGMLAGLFPGSAAAGIGIADKLGTASPAAMVAAEGLVVASGATFLGGQAAMFGYAGARMQRGKATEKQLQANRRRVEGNADLVEVIDKDIAFNQKHSINYGRNTMIGQGFMMTGTSLALSGVGSLASLPFLAVGAPMTIVPAVSRIVQEGKEEKFHGDSELPYAEGRIAKAATEIVNAAYADTLKTEFDSSSNQLAHIKLYSLLHHLTNDRKYKHCLPEEKLACLDKITKDGRLSTLRSTGLQGKILERVQQIAQDNRETIRGFFNNKFPDAILRANIVQCTNGDSPVFTLDSRVDGKQLTTLTQSLDLEEKLKGKSYEAQNALIINRLKSACKAIRYDLVEKRVCASHCIALQQDIQRGESYAILKTALSEQHEMAEQQKKLEDFQRHSQPFLLRKTIQEAGKKRYIWDDPAHKDEDSFSITYIVDESSGKMDVIYGKKASAIIAADADISALKGVMVVEIGDGKHTILGDQQHVHIENIAAEVKNEKSKGVWERNSMSRSMKKLYGTWREAVHSSCQGAFLEMPCR